MLGAMCEDCERPFEAVLEDKPACACAHCRSAGFVLAVQRPAGSVQSGLSPWCVDCHHFILTGHLRPE